MRERVIKTRQIFSQNALSVLSVHPLQDLVCVQVCVFTCALTFVMCVSVNVDTCVGNTEGGRGVHK